MKPDRDAHDMTPEEQMAAGDKATVLFDQAGAANKLVTQAKPPENHAPLPPTTPQFPSPQAQQQLPPETAPLRPARPQQPPVAEPPDGATKLILPPGHSTGRTAGGPAVGRQPAEAPPVVGFLVVIEGPGRGNYRPVYGGANTIGRNAGQRIPIDFGDDTISGDQQAFLVYDARTRQFQLVPNLGRPNLVHLNDQALLTNAVLAPRDQITMGRTRLLFMPFCGTDFDWADEAASA